MRQEEVKQVCTKMWLFKVFFFSIIYIVSMLFVSIEFQYWLAIDFIEFCDRFCNFYVVTDK